MTPRLGAALAGLALLCAAGGTALVLTSAHEESRVATLVLAVPVGLAFVGSGIVAWARRPENRTGRLMVLTGLTWFLGSLSEANHPAVFTLGIGVSAITYIFFVYLVLAFPSGRLQSSLDRVLVGATVALSTVGTWTVLLVADFDECEGCPRNVVQVADLNAAEPAVQFAIQALAAAITLTVAVVLFRRWRRAAPALRRALTPVLLTTALSALLFTVGLAAQPFSERVAVALDWCSLVAFLGVPLAFLFGLLRSRLARVGAARMLLETVPDEPSLEEAEEGLRRALRDPTLKLLLWSGRARGYVDAQGRPVDLPENSETHVVTKIEYENRPLAALVHDVTLLEESELLEDVIAAARVALEKDRTLRTLRVTEMRSRALLDAIPDNMFRVTREGGYLDASIKDERYLPVPAAELPDTKIQDVLPEETARLILDAVGRALDSGEVQTVEYRMQRPIGLRDSEARIVASGEDEAVIIVRDISERKAADAELRRLHDELEVRAEELQRERDLLGTVVDTAPAFFCGVDPDGRIIRFNRALELLSGRADDESTRGQLFWKVFVTPDEQGAFEQRFRDAMRDPAKVEHENRWLSAEGEPAVVAWSAAWYPGEGGADRYLISGSDVTERHRSAAELERERNFLNAIANNAPSLLCLIDEHGVVADRATNLAFEQMLDYNTSETGGHVFWAKYVHPDDADQVRDRIERVVAGEEVREHDSRWVSRGGRTFLIAWSCTPLPRIDERRLFLISGVDVTQRTRHEEQLRRERDFLETVAGATPTLMCVVDAEGRITSEGVNPAFREKTGYATAEAHGRLLTELVVESGERDEVARTLAEVAAGLPMERRESCWETQTGKRLLVEWVSIPLAPAREDQFLIAAVDVTVRKRQEEEIRKSRARLVEAGDAERRRLERNLHDGAQQRLVSLSLSLRRAQAKVRSNPEAADRILDEASAELAVALEELRELARGIHPAVLTDRGLGPALESLVLRAPIRVDLESLPADPLPGQVEAAAFYVVSEALANVAKYAQASAARVRIERADGYALVEVADDGVGGADPSRGTGLRGLADRVEALDGRLDVESAPGEGTVIRAEIPVSG